jgi:hypothetical protein
MSECSNDAGAEIAFRGRGYAIQSRTFLWNGGLAYMDEKLRDSLLFAYGVIRQQEDLIYSLMALTTPLVKCLGQYDRRLAEMYRQAMKANQRKIFQERKDGFALIDEAIRRLKENVG